MLLCLLNTVMNYISRICNEGERHPFNPCSPYQQSFSRTRIIKIFTDVIALRQYLLKNRNPLNPLYPCSFKKVFALPTEFFSNTDYKDFHGCYCLVACNSCLRRGIR